MKFSDALQPNSPLMAPILQESYSGESATKEKRPGLFSVIKALQPKESNSAEVDFFS